MKIKLINVMFYAKIFVFYIEGFMEEIELKYLKYCRKYMHLINLKYSNATEDIKLKENHGLIMKNGVRDLTIKSGMLNESYTTSASIEGLLHDIGRFPQYLLSGTLIDTESEKYTGFINHGEYGRYMLLKDDKKLLRYFLPEETQYDKVLVDVVGEHTKLRNPSYMYDIRELENIFPNYSLDEILKSENTELLNKLISLKIKLLKEVDSLEILYKVRDGLWYPKISSNSDDYIKDEVWDIFLNLNRIDMKTLKEKGLWTCNSGFLLRYSLILNNINFTGTLKSILEDGTIDKIYQVQKENSKTKDGNFEIDELKIDSRLHYATIFTKLAVENLIECSSDGKIITKEDKMHSKEKILSLWRV